MNNNGMKQTRIAVIVIGVIALTILCVFWVLATYGPP